MTREHMPEEVPDEVPVADALEQQRDHGEPVPDTEAPATDSDSPPLEATDPDWLEQREVVTVEPDPDEFDRQS